eukprot:260765_1
MDMFINKMKSNTQTYYKERYYKDSNIKLHRIYFFSPSIAWGDGCEMQLRDDSENLIYMYTVTRGNKYYYQIQYIDVYIEWSELDKKNGIQLLFHQFRIVKKEDSYCNEYERKLIRRTVTKKLKFDDAAFYYKCYLHDDRADIIHFNKSVWETTKKFINHELFHETSSKIWSRSQYVSSRSGHPSGSYGLHRYRFC